MTKVETKKHRPIVYRYYDYLKKNHMGAENGIKSYHLAEVFGVQLGTQKYILKEINESADFDKLISTSGSIYMCKRKDECLKAINNELKTAITRIKKAHAMANKLSKNNNYKIKMGDYYNDFVTVFSEEQ